MAEMDQPRFRRAAASTSSSQVSMGRAPSVLALRGQHRPDRPTNDDGSVTWVLGVGNFSEQVWGGSSERHHIRPENDQNELDGSRVVSLSLRRLNAISRGSEGRIRASWRWALTPCFR